MRPFLFGWHPPFGFFSQSYKLSMLSFLRFRRFWSSVGRTVLLRCSVGDYFGLRQIYPNKVKSAEISAAGGSRYYTYIPYDIQFMVNLMPRQSVRFSNQPPLFPACWPASFKEKDLLFLLISNLHLILGRWCIKGGAGTTITLWVLMFWVYQIPTGMSMVFSKWIITPL